jgi:hypothetical protein
VPSPSIASNSALAIANRSDERRGQKDTGGPGVVLTWCTVFWRISRSTPEGRVKSGNSAKRSSAGVRLPMVFKLRHGVDVVWAGNDREVTASRILLLRQSTKRLKLDSRSTLKIGSWTSATTKR